LDSPRRFCLIGAASSVVTVTVGLNPGASAIIPQTNELVVVNDQSSDASVIDPIAHAVSTVHAGLNPAAVAVNPQTGYATSPIRTTTPSASSTGTGRQKKKVVPVGEGPSRSRFNPKTNRIYVADIMGDSVTAIDGNTNETTDIPVGARPRGIAVNAITNRVYVANIWTGTVSVIDGSANTVIATDTGRPAAVFVAVNQSTNKVYVANATEQVTQPGTVTVIDGATHKTASVVAGIQPAFVAVNTTTNRIYVLGAQANGDVTVIDGATGDTTHVAIPYAPGASRC